MFLPSRSSRTDGLAIFAVAAFGLAVATTLALDRVGAPDGLVRGAAPVLVLVGFATIGMGAHNADLASFLAARRGLHPFYGALTVAAAAAGMTLSLDPGFGRSPNPPFLAWGAGVVLAAAGLAPLVRRFGATWPSDVIATRFPIAPLRIVFTVPVWTTAALTAFAGYRSAVTAVAPLVASNRAWGEAIVAIVIAMCVTPGGLAGVVWCGAAGAATIAIVAIVGAASAWGMGAPLAAAAVPFSMSAALTSPYSQAAAAAALLAIASFFALEPAAMASRNAWSAVKSGFGGAVLLTGFAVAGGICVSTFAIGPGPNASNPVVASLAAAAMLASALTLACVGVHGTARAFGLALAAPRKPFPTLASVRLARMRAAQLVAVIACAAVDSRGLLEPQAALTLALALSLAVTLPLLGLAAIGRAGPASVTAAMAVELGAGYARLGASPLSIEGRGLIETAAFVAGVAFVAGALVSLIAPRRGPPPTPGPFDPFASG